MATTTDTNKTAAAEAAAEKLAAMGIGTPPDEVVPAEPETLEAVATYLNSKDGSKVSNPKQYLDALTLTRETFSLLKEAVATVETRTVAASNAIMAVRRTIIDSNGRPDVNGDTFLWKTYVGPKLKVEVGAALWDNAVLNYQRRHLIIPQTVVELGIKSGDITKDDATAYRAVMKTNGGNLAKVVKDDFAKLPEAVVDFVNKVASESAQPESATRKLIPPKVRQTREERLKADPAKAIAEAVSTLTTVATVDGNGDGPKVAPLSSWETYYRGESALIRSMVLDASGAPRKGGIEGAPAVRAEMVKCAKAITAYIGYEEKGIPDLAGLLKLLYSEPGTTLAAVPAAAEEEKTAAA